MRFTMLPIRTTLALGLCAILVVLAYFFVDRPVAFFVHDHKIPSHAILRWLTDPPPIVQAWTPLLLTVLFVRWWWGPLTRWQLALLIGCVGMVVADQFRESLAYVCGRYWPETWIDHNPSLIGDGAYGFHPFHDGRNYGSFPSGHATRTAAVAGVVWVAYPRWRWAAVAACIAVAVGLLGMDYHFVGDVIAGTFLGGMVGGYAAVYANLYRPP